LLKKATKDLKEHLDPISGAEKVKYLEKKYLDTSAPHPHCELARRLVKIQYVDDP